MTIRREGGNRPQFVQYADGGVGALRRYEVGGYADRGYESEQSNTGSSDGWGGGDWGGDGWGGGSNYGDFAGGADTGAGIGYSGGSGSGIGDLGSSGIGGIGSPGSSFGGGDLGGNYGGWGGNDTGDTWGGYNPDPNFGAGVDVTGGYGGPGEGSFSGFDGTAHPSYGDAMAVGSDYLGSLFDSASAAPAPPQDRGWSISDLMGISPAAAAELSPEKNQNRLEALNPDNQYQMSTVDGSAIPTAPSLADQVLGPVNAQRIDPVQPEDNESLIAKDIKDVGREISSIVGSALNGLFGWEAPAAVAAPTPPASLEEQAAAPNEHVKAANEAFEREWAEFQAENARAKALEAADEVPAAAAELAPSFDPMGNYTGPYGSPTAVAGYAPDFEAVDQQPPIGTPQNLGLRDFAPNTVMAENLGPITPDVGFHALAGMVPGVPEAPQPARERVVADIPARTIEGYREAVREAQRAPQAPARSAPAAPEQTAAPTPSAPAGPRTSVARGPAAAPTERRSVAPEAPTYGYERLPSHAFHEKALPRAIDAAVGLVNPIAGLVNMGFGLTGNSLGRTIANNTYPAQALNTGYSDYDVANPGTPRMAPAAASDKTKPPPSTPALPSTAPLPSTSGYALEDTGRRYLGPPKNPTRYGYGEERTYFASRGGLVGALSRMASR